MWRRQDRVDRGLALDLMSVEMAELTAAKKRLADLEAKLVVSRRAVELWGGWVRLVAPKTKCAPHPPQTSMRLPYPHGPVSEAIFAALRHQSRMPRHLPETDVEDSQIALGGALRVPLPGRWRPMYGTSSSRNNQSRRFEPLQERSDVRLHRALADVEALADLDVRAG